MKIYGLKLEGPFTLNKVSTLTEFVPSADMARLVYAEDVDKIYYGSET
jgi:hypothetical protein